MLYTEKQITRAAPPETLFSNAYPSSALNKTIKIAAGATVIVALHAYSFRGDLCQVYDNMVGSYTVIAKSSGATENGGMLAVYWGHPGGTVQVTGQFSNSSSSVAGMIVNQYDGLEPYAYAVKSAGSVWASTSTATDLIPHERDGKTRKNGIGIMSAMAYGTLPTFPGEAEDKSTYSETYSKIATAWTKGFLGETVLELGIPSSTSAVRLSAVFFADRVATPLRRRAYVDAAAGGGSSLDATATGQAQVGGAATLSAQIALAGVGVSVASGTASAAVTVPLSAAGIMAADGAAGATATVSVSAAGLAQAAASAGLSASVLLAGAGAAQAAGNGHLTALLEMLAAGAAEASGSAQLSGGAQGDLSASGQASAGGAGVLMVTVSLSAAGVAEASGSASGSAGSPGDVSAAGGAVADGSATWSAVLQLTAPGFVQAMGAGALSVDVSLVAAGAGQASGQARASLAGAVAAYCISSSARRVTEIFSAARLVTTINHEVRCVCD